MHFVSTPFKTSIKPTAFNPISLETAQKRVEALLSGTLTRLWQAKYSAPALATLQQAVTYSLLNGGKRIRPWLLYSTGQALGAPLKHLDAAACAIELIHGYSLVHDDLPAMDNDDLRRGKPTCHKAFGERTAILTGDALQTMAFEILSNADWNPLPAHIQIKQINCLARAAGLNGMVGGQQLDLACEGKTSITVTELTRMHEYKTGALIRASVDMAAEAADCQDNATRQALIVFAESLGLAFQVKDDLLDIESDTETLGKPMGSDVMQDKMTLPRLLGIDETRKTLERLLQTAQEALSGNESLQKGLAPIAEFCVARRF